MATGSMSSLQLVGKGIQHTDFTWELQLVRETSIPGQRFGDLVFINEIHYDNAGTDPGLAALK
jgi:hypothetical protein